jgi:hypothetical protein
MRTMRMIGLVVLGCVVVGVGAVAGLLLWLGAQLGIGVGIGVGLLVIGAYLTVIGPWQRRWGATDQEVQGAMPGDELLRADAPTTTRGITIDASSEEVFRWLLQIGYGRGGWYSYDWIDNDGKPSVDRIDPDLQRLAVGDRIEMLPGMGPIVREIEPNNHVLSAGETDSWCLLVAPLGGGGTRLISRWRQDWPKTAGTKAWIALADPGAFVMEQKMLRTIRHLAEGSARNGGVLLRADQS